MIPLRDVIPSRSTPIFNIAFIILNAVAFVFELTLPPPTLTSFIYTYGVVPGQLSPISLVTSMFLHGGWLHFLGNMLYLWIFGDNVEDRLGHFRYVFFYLLCGVAAALAQVVMNPASTIPMVGASGAIAGVMGAYFVLYPHSRVLALVPLFIIWEVIEVPAIIFLGIWFLMQFFSGVGSIASDDTLQAGHIAFWAHVAGFVVGVLAGVVLRKPARRHWT